MLTLETLMIKIQEDVSIRSKTNSHIKKIDLCSPFYDFLFCDSNFSSKGNLFYAIFLSTSHCDATSPYLNILANIMGDSLISEQKFTNL
ncbi:hypothetical protein BpHYR1_047967 [Brachionus plicatilis]|uniref:Uncharacterized protein n=1 Tax=Brachionus plicatilis TaxID=10195 RepID=A0A3M7T9I9_BRAPC|nr:hypothetical protein BpHYR1_047967 [Brachionus plicatilis]